MTPNAPVIWRESVAGMDFVHVPGGTFTMGSREGEPGRCDDEGPIHEVHVDSFWMSRFTVTNAQYRIFCPHHISGKGGFYSFDPVTKQLVVLRDEKWKLPDNRNLFNGPNQPAMGVSWNDANAFARWLGAQNLATETFDLPTEAQWEYACRAGTEAARFWGEGPADAVHYANVYDRHKQAVFKLPWDCHDCDSGKIGTSDVGSFRPNAFGLYDMLGNVWEWCRDVYSPDAYTRHSKSNPCLEEKVAGRIRRVRRGGGWLSCPMGVRSACRRCFSPGFATYPLGIRLIRV